MGCDCTFTKLFLKQFFDIGKSAGSLVREIIGLFQTFQKLSAPSKFETRFSHECIQWFRWATDIFYYITNSIRTDPLSEFELYTIYSYILPITLLCFISVTISSGPPIFYYFLYGMALILGSGIGMIGVNSVGAIICITIAIGVIVIYVIYKCVNCECFSSCKQCYYNGCCCCKKSKMGESDIEVNSDEIVHSAVISCLIFSAMMYPIASKRYNIQLIMICAVAIVIVIFFCASVFTNGFMPDIVRPFILKIISFSLNLIPLLIIPSTEKFVTIMQGNYKGQWTIIASYIVISLLIPTLITLLMLIKGNQEIREPYKEGNYCYVELVDTIRQVLYAIFAAYDILWGCAAIELFWVILIIAVRPYSGVSDYFLSIGNSLVILISNGSLIYANYVPMKKFDFTASIIFIAITCVPAVLSLYFYFIFDFNIEEDSDDDEEYDKSVNAVTFFAMTMTPVAWLFYGLVIPLIDGKRNIKNDL